MNRYPLKLFALALTATLAACGGGGGGGGGGGTSLTTPVTISATNFTDTASLVARTLNVADSPNFNEGFPAAVVHVAPLRGISILNLARVQMAQIAKVQPGELRSAELPVGATPVPSPTPIACATSGTLTRTYTDANNDLDTLEDGNKLVITYANCKFDLLQEANNCILPVPSQKLIGVTLDGIVETTIKGAATKTEFATEVVYRSLKVTNSANQTSTFNGSIQLSQTVAAPQFTVTVISGNPLQVTSGTVIEQLSSGVIKYDDNRQNCDPASDNNAYDIDAAATAGRVAANNLGYVDFDVTANLKGDSDLTKGFPSSGKINITGGGGTVMTIEAIGSDQAKVEFNNNGAPCVFTWDQLNDGTKPPACP